MARMKDLAESTSDMFNILVDKIEIEADFNVRISGPEYNATIREIADSIKAQGFLRSRPLTVRQLGDRIVIVDGHTRFAAVQLVISEGVEIRSLPCVLEPRHTTAEDRNLTLITANNGRQLSPMEKAIVVKRQLSFGWTEQQIAAKLGVSYQQVCNWLAVASADREVRDAVASGDVAFTEAVKIVKRDGDKAADTIKAAVAANGGKRVTAKNLRGNAPPPASDEPSRTPRQSAAAQSVAAQSVARKLVLFEAAMRDALGVDNLAEAKSILSAALRGVPHCVDEQYSDAA